MPRSPIEQVVSHWHKTVGNFSTSSLAFYTAVEQALDRHELPRVHVTRVDYEEGGVLAPRREYLRITSAQHAIDICAAPVGQDYFFSAWTTELRANFVLVYYLLFALATWALWHVLMVLLPGVEASGPLWARSNSPLLSPFVLVPGSFLTVVMMVVLAARSGWYGPERAMQTIPFVAAVYTDLFVPETYYRLDNMLMFHAAVHSALHETIDGLLTTKGLRRLSDRERQPMFRELVLGSTGSRSEPAGSDSAAGTSNEQALELAGSVGS